MERYLNMILKNCTVYTMAGDTIEQGYIQIQNGKIVQVGHGQPQKTEEETLDLQGARVYPGFIDAHTHLGIFEDGLDFEGDDCNEDTEPVTPHLRAIDAINPMDNCFEEALRGGVTTVVTGPGSANPISGQLAAIKTYGSCIDRMIIKAPLAIKMALGENPKSVYHDKSQTPVTRMATAALIREQLYKAKHYMEEKRRALEEEDVSPPEYDLKCEALIPALEKEIQVHFHAHRADDIFTAIRLAGEFDLDYVIVHGTEGHMIADALREEGARVLSGPFLSDRSKPELRNLTPESPGILIGRGIPTAIITDHPVIPLQYLTMAAGLAVREGADYDEILKSITITPARICGIDRQVGSIEQGKDADLVVFEQDPLLLCAKPSMVFVDGVRRV